jgi:hypothetical protein
MKGQYLERHRSFMNFKGGMDIAMRKGLNSDLSIFIAALRVEKWSCIEIGFSTGLVLALSPIRHVTDQDV